MASGKCKKLLNGLKANKRNRRPEVLEAVLKACGWEPRTARKEGAIWTKKQGSRYGRVTLSSPHGRDRVALLDEVLTVIREIEALDDEVLDDDD